MEKKAVSIIIGLIVGHFVDLAAEDLFMKLGFSRRTGKIAGIVIGAFI